MRKDICVSISLFGLGLIGYGLYSIYQPFGYIYCGIILIFFGNIYSGEKKK